MECFVQCGGKWSPRGVGLCVSGRCVWIFTLPGSTGKSGENSFWTRLLIPSPLFACRHHGYARHDAKVGRRNVSPQKTLPNGVGASRILLDAHIPFDIVDAEMDWSGCRFPLLPDEVLLFPVFARKR